MDFEIIKMRRTQGYSAYKRTQLADARAARWQIHALPHVIDNPIQFAFAAIVHGGKFAQSQQILAFCNILILSDGI
jgi:hypothetical protein